MKFFNNLGLAYRAQKVIIGIDEIEKNYSSIRLIILSSNTSVKTQKKIISASKKYNIKLIYIAEQFPEQIGYSIGKSSVKIIGITDAGFSKMLINN